MLRDRGIAVPDAQELHPRAVTCGRYVETQRAVAEHIALGAWCDPLAWAAIFTEVEHLALGAYVNNRRRRAR